MRSKLSFVPAACLAVVSLLAASGCASNPATTGGANAASSSASPTTSDRSAAAQSNAQGAENGTTAGQSANATSGASPASSSGAAGSKGADACALLTSDDIKAVQGEPVKESKPSRRDDQSLRVSQCFFTTATFNKSVSLEVTTSTDGTSARRFWDERFGRAREEAGKGEREREREKREREERDKKKAGARGEEEEEEGALPTPVKGIGDEAYWAGSRVNGTLYARKGDAFVRVSVGGADSDAERQRKAKALAERALARL